MAKWSWSEVGKASPAGNAWADTTEQSIATSAVRLKAIKIWPNKAQSAIAYVDLWNVADPTPGTTTPTLRIPVPSATSQGSNKPINIPLCGIRFDTALTIFCSSDGGATAPLTTVIPQEIQVFYELGN